MPEPSPSPERDWIVTDLGDDGGPLRLELVAFRPSGPGPHPTLLWHHGSTGSASPRAIRQTHAHPALPSWLAARGWLVLMAQRRGRGRSEGRYAEGLAPNGKGYACDPQTAHTGATRALEDCDAILAHARSRPDVDPMRLVVGGASRGGVLAIAHAGRHPSAYLGAVEFSGGWLGRLCDTHEAVNRQLFVQGAAFARPTLWVHGSRDRYYSITQCERCFAAFTAAGGQGQFQRYPLGHNLVGQPKFWGNVVERFLATL